MNIIYVVEDFSENGGVERIVSMKANLLAEQLGHQVTLISVYKDQRPEQFVLGKQVRLLHLDVPFAQKSKSRLRLLVSRVSTLLTAIKRLNQTVGKLHPDIIFFTTTLGALLLPFCRTRAKRVYESHLARSYNPYHQLFGWMERRADRVVCLTQGDAKDFPHAKKVCVIPNFIDMPSRQVVDYSCKRVIAVGRLEYQKGFDILIDCWSEVARQYPDWQLDIYGEGSCHEALQEQIVRLHLERQVTLKGRCSHVVDVYPDYSLQVMSSRFEGQGIVLLEGQACGLPSVSFDFQYGASDIITHEVNGLLVQQGNRQAFAGAIMQMMASEEKRREYGAHALAMSQRYSQQQIFKLWQQLIESLS